VDPRRIDPATRITLALLSRLFDWRDALVVIQPKTLIRWHRAGFRLLWHWKSKPGRPPIPAELRRLIREMSRDNLLYPDAQPQPRDNVLIEYGIFASSLGRERTIIWRSGNPKQASDLGGLVFIQYGNGRQEQQEANVGFVIGV
jgi:hypothetical protein